MAEHLFYLPNIPVNSSVLKTCHKLKSQLYLRLLKIADMFIISSGSGESLSIDVCENEMIL